MRSRPRRVGTVLLGRDLIEASIFPCRAGKLREKIFRGSPHAEKPRAIIDLGTPPGKNRRRGREPAGKPEWPGRTLANSLSAAKKRVSASEKRRSGLGKSADINLLGVVWASRPAAEFWAVFGRQNAVGSEMAAEFGSFARCCVIIIARLLIPDRTTAEASVYGYRPPPQGRVCCYISMIKPFTIDNITRMLYVRRRARRRKPGGRIGVREMEKLNVRDGA